MLEASLSDTSASSLVRLIYVSGITTHDSSVFEHIQGHSASFNKQNNIAGFLCNNHSSFLQCLEGTKEALSSLMERIFKDIHHKEVNVVFTKRIKAYTFTDWRMHSLSLNRAQWEKFSTHTQLDDISPFKPEKWPSWFVEHFIETVKTIDYSSINQDHITFDRLGYSEVVKKLTSDNILFYIFISLLLCSTVAVLLFRHNAIS